MIILGNTTQSLQIALAAPVQANPLHFVTSFVDGNSTVYDPDPYTGTVGDTAPVDLAPAPVGGRKRKVASVTVYNDDSAAATVILTYKDGDTVRKLPTVTIQPGETLQYGDGGWCAIDVNGAFKQTLAAPIPDGSLSLGKLQQIPGQSLTGNSALTPANVQPVTMGYMLQLSGQKLIYSQSFEDYCASVGFDVTSGSDATAVLQAFRIKGYLFALALGARSLSDQGKTIRVRQTCNATRPIRITSPDVVPPFVESDFKTQILRDGSQGSPTAYFNGAPDSYALANPCQPAVILAAGAHCANVSINCNPGTGPLGSGFYAVRGWRITGGTIASGGSGGKSVGDKFTTANAHLAPYGGATCTITAVDGSGRPTAFTVDGGVGGLYPFPSQLLVNTWTAANGFNGAKYPQVFDSSGKMLTSLPGVSIDVVWEQDWSVGNSIYFADVQAPQVDCILGNIRIDACGTANDATYGPVRACHLQGLFINYQTIYSTGGYIGNSVNATDVIGGTMYNTGGFIQFKKFAGGNMHSRVICDTPANGGHFFDMDRADGNTIDLRCFNNGTTDLTGAPYAGRIGANTSDSVTTTGKLVIQMENAGTPSGLTGLFIDRAQNLDIDLQIINKKNGSPLPYPITKAVVFGNNNGSGNRLTGVVDGISGALYSGPTSGWSIRLADGNAGGWLCDGGVYEITGSGAPLNGASGTGIGKAPLGSTYKDTATGYSYRNAGTASSLNWVRTTAPAGYQMLATRCGLNSAAQFPVGNPGVAVRMQHYLPYGAKRLAPLYSAFWVTSTNPDTETKSPGGYGFYCISAAPSGGSSYAVGDTITPTVATNQFAPTLQVDAVSAGVPTALSVLDAGGFGAVPASGLATTTSGSGTGCTVTLTVKACAFVARMGIEQAWGTQTAESASNTLGVAKLTAGANATGGKGNIVIPFGEEVLTDPVEVGLPPGTLISSRFYTPGTGMYVGRYISGSSGLNESSRSNEALANNNAYGGTFTASASPAPAFQPIAVMGIPMVPGPTFGLIGDSIGYGSISVSGGTATHEAMDADGNSGYLERAIDRIAPFTNFCTPTDRMTNWLSQTGPTLRMRLLSQLNLSHVIDEMGINDAVGGGDNYATFKAKKIAFWNMLLGLNAKEIWATTLTPNSNSTKGLSALPTIANGGSGYAANSTFNVTISGGTQTQGAAVVSVSTNGSGVVTTVNSIVSIGYYTANPSTPNSPTGGSGSGLSLNLTFDGWLDLASQTPAAANTTIQAYNADLRSRASWIAPYITRVLDLGAGAESSVGSGIWPAGGTLDGLHPTQAQTPLLSAQISSQFATATL